MPPNKPIGLSDYKNVLVAYEREYRESWGHECKEIVQDIMKEMVAQSKGTLDKDLMKELDQVSWVVQTCSPEILLTWAQKIHTWYNNHKSVPLKDESTLVRVGTVWNYRLVVQHLYKDQIANHMAKTNLTPKDPGWIKNFQLSVNAVIKSLGGDDKVAEKYGETAKSWNEVELPDELKRK